MNQMINDLKLSSLKAAEVTLLILMMSFVAFNVVLVLAANYESAIEGTSFLEELGSLIVYFYGK